MNEKVTKASVEYRDAPNGKQKCSGCTMWIYPNQCTAVKGIISSEGWCKIYAAKGG